MKLQMPLALGAALLAGCSGFRVALPPEEAPRIAQSKPRVVVLIPGRNVQLSEYLLKVYGWKTQVHSYSINGIWDPAPALESPMVEELNARLGCAAQPLRSAIPADAFAQLVARREREVGGKREEDVFGSLVEQAYRPGDFPDADYLCELTVGKFIVGSGTWQANTLGMTLYGRLIRLSDGAVLWRDKKMAGVRIQGMESFADLEKNNLALLKSHFEKLVGEFIKPDSDFVSGLRLP
jgi:hypothetical protein